MAITWALKLFTQYVSCQPTRRYNSFMTPVLSTDIYFSALKKYLFAHPSLSGRGCGYEEFYCNYLSALGLYTVRDIAL
jgi:hypothetical protein